MRYIEGHGLPGHPDELSRHHRVGYKTASRGAFADVRLTRSDEAATVAMPARFTTTDSGAVLSAGLDGLGIVEVAEFVARPYIASGSWCRCCRHGKGV